MGVTGKSFVLIYSDVISCNFSRDISKKGPRVHEAVFPILIVILNNSWIFLSYCSIVAKDFKFNLTGSRSIRIVDPIYSASLLSNKTKNNARKNKL